ncbi:MAG: type II secretion system F family protein [Planctomycetota bacterium]
MPTFRYQATTPDGQSKEGVLQAPNANAAAAAVRAQGLRIVSMAAADETHGQSFAQKLKRLNTAKPTQKHVLEFTTQLAVMVRAGINLRSALDGIAEQTTHPEFKRIIIGLKQDVESGKQFSDAVAKHPKLFNELYISMVRASEMSGSFAEMLDRIAGYIAQQIETKKMVVGASIYPGIIGTLAVVVTVFLLTFVLPKFYTLFEGKEDVLPWATNFLMNLSQYLQAQWYLVVGVAAAVGIGGYLGGRTPAGKLYIDQAKLAIPVLKGMFRSLYISRSVQTMSQLIHAGVPMLDTLEITASVSGNQLYSRMWRSVHNSVKQGRNITGPMQAADLLPKSVVQMISAGEESGKLSEVMDEISSYYSKLLKDQIKAVTSLIEPIMILVMGGVVGFIAMAIIMPIFKMSQIVG